MRFLHFLIVILFISVQLCGQHESPYKLSWKKEIITLAGGTALVGTSLTVPHEETSLTLEELNELNPNNVFFIDRRATEQYSEKADKISDIGQFGPMLAGVAFGSILPVITKQPSWFNETFKLGLMLFETNLINSGLTEVVKVSVKRIRPLAYNDEAPMTEREDFEIRKSFFSGHTSSSAANMFFMAKVFSDYFPDSKWKPAVWGIAAAVPAWTGYMRYKAGRHFPTDIIAGYIVGVATGYLVPLLHKVKPADNDLNLSLVPYHDLYSSGAVFSLTF